MFNLRSIFVILITFVLGASIAAAQGAVPPALGADRPTASEERIRLLEVQLKLLQEQIEALRATVEAKEKAALPIPNTTATAGEPAVDRPTSSPAVSLAAQQKTPGIDIGSARLTPYGTIYFNAFGNSGGTNNADVPLFATASGPSHFSATVRQTRLGLRLEGARVGSARLSGVIEADFFGGLPAVGIGENFGVVRIRLANAKLDWERTSVTIGQDWMVFAPVNPTSLAAAAIPQMAAAGNPWARLPLVRVDHKLNKNLTWSGSVLAPQTGDSSAAGGFFLQPNSGASSRTPFFQSRLLFSDNDWLGSKKSGSIGVSGHYGRSRVFTSGNRANVIDSVGVAVDWNFPLHARVQLLGEAFAGRNLGGFQAGIYQNYNADLAKITPSGLVAGGVRAIATGGGWVQLGFTPDVAGDKLGLYVSAGLDDPRNEDLVSFTPRDLRSRNMVFATNAIYKFTPQFSIGAEYRRFQTDYLLTGRRNGDHINLAAAYTF